MFLHSRTSTLLTRAHDAFITLETIAEGNDVVKSPYIAISTHHELRDGLKAPCLAGHDAAYCFLTDNTMAYMVQEIVEGVEDEGELGALEAIARYACALRHPARLAYISGMAAAAAHAGFSESVTTFSELLQKLPNAPEPDIRCAVASQLAPLGNVVRAQNFIPLRNMW